MQFMITGRHLQMSDPIRAYAEEKVTHGLAEFPRVESVHVILDIEKYRHQAEVFVQASGHVRVDARHTSEDMYVSIDQAVDKAARQLRRLRDKVQDHRGRESVAEVEQQVERHLQETSGEDGDETAREPGGSA